MTKSYSCSPRLRAKTKQQHVNNSFYYNKPSELISNRYVNGVNVIFIPDKCIDNNVVKSLKKNSHNQVGQDNTILKKCPHKYYKSQVIPIDLRTRNKSTTNNRLNNGPKLKNARQKDLKPNYMNNHAKDRIKYKIIKTLASYDFNKQYLTKSSIGDNLKHRVKFKVNDLSKKHNQIK